MHLSVSDISKSFDGTIALNGVTLSFPASSIKTIVGPNGSGKTTLFNIVSGLTLPDAGAVLLEQENITGHAPYVIARRGIGRLFQHPRIFEGLSVLDNIQVAASDAVGDGLFSAAKHIRTVIRQRGQIYEQAKEIVAMLGLTNSVNEMATNLSYGQIKTLAIGQLLMRKPSVLLLDELTAGLDDNILSKLLRVLIEMKDAGKCIILIEHRWELTTSISDSMAILRAGSVIADCSTQDAVKILQGCEGMW